MPENTFVSVDYRVYGELMEAKSTADALKSVIRKKFNSYGDITRTEIELLHALFCEKEGGKD